MLILAEQKRRLNFPVTRDPHRLPRLFAFTDEQRGPEPLALINRLPTGAGLVFRHYHATNRAELATAAVKACKRRGICCLIAGDLKLARTLKADGLHLAEWQLNRPLYGLADFRRQGGLVTAAAHSLSAALLAEKQNVDGIFISPVFPTKSHPGAAHLGLMRFAGLNQKLIGPSFALGGVNFQSERKLLFAGAYGMAGIGLFE